MTDTTSIIQNSLFEINWMAQSDLPLLAILQLLPLTVALLMLFFKGRGRAAAQVAMLTLVVEAMVALQLYHGFDSATSALQFGEHLTLLAPLNYHAAVDGMALLFILLTAILGVMVVLYGWQVLPEEEHPHFMATVLFIVATLMSLLTTQNLLWFILMSAIQLVPIGTLLRAWSTSPEKDEAVTRFIQFMSIGLLLLFIGTFLLGWNYAEQHHGVWSFDLIELQSTPVPTAIHSILFFLLFYGFAIRVPLFPFHGWLPSIAEHGTVAIAPVFLLGLKTGIYGILRFVLPLMPEAVIQWSPYVIAFAIVGIFYAALLAMIQVNLRRLLAFAVVSHTSIIIIGLFSLNHLAFQGSVLLSINFGLAISGLLLMNGLIFYRTRTLLMSRLGGLFDQLPVIGIAFFISGLSIMGMPGTPGFDAAHLVIEAAMEHYGALPTIAASLGNVVAAGFLLWAFQR
ncbi:MAG TPA: NADH-quinone oxidoreductase subunit M, partial [Gammaproteobacteria bacterium]|nr:NADH-quinone oxidoreductase subunit M [Gammaproteobacteria bacterium]